LRKPQLEVPTGELHQ